MADLTLVSHHLCPYVQRAVVALSEKGVAFERLDVDLAAKPAWFQAISPLGKVPLLKVARPGRGDVVLFESAVICEFIEETQGGAPLHPADPIARAEHRAWIEFASAILNDISAFYTAPDPALFEVKRTALAAKFSAWSTRSPTVPSSPASASASSTPPSGRCSATSMSSTPSPISAS